jgi:hypothetical protein
MDSAIGLRQEPIQMNKLDALLPTAVKRALLPGHLQV